MNTRSQPVGNKKFLKKKFTTAIFNLLEIEPCNWVLGTEWFGGEARSREITIGLLLGNNGFFRYESNGFRSRFRSHLEMGVKFFK